MGRVSTERMVMDGAVKAELDFKYSIDVSREGVFSTMLPKNIVDLFQGANVSLCSNRLKNPGYLCSNTLDGIKLEVKNICQEYLSRDCISQTVVLKFGIETRCTYCLGTGEYEGEIYPNGYFPGAFKKDDKYAGGGYTNWKQGNIEINASGGQSNYGLLVYVYPYKKEIFKYKSGTKKTEYSRLQSGPNTAVSPEKTPNLYWLNNLSCIAPGSGFSGSSNAIKVQEIEYTEEIAGVFVSMIKSICALNEKIKDFLTPEGILLLAESNQKLLG